MCIMSGLTRQPIETRDFYEIRNKSVFNMVAFSVKPSYLKFYLTSYDAGLLSQKSCCYLKKF